MLNGDVQIDIMRVVGDVILLRRSIALIFIAKSTQPNTGEWILLNKIKRSLPPLWTFTHESHRMFNHRLEARLDMLRHEK